MKRSIFHLVSAVALLSVALSAQLVTVRSKIGLGSGNPPSGRNYLHFETINCGANWPIQVDASGGILTVVSRTFDIVANAQGIAQGTVIGNDQITCGNVASTQWRVSVLSAQGIPVSGPKKFFICSAAATNQQCAQVAGAGGTFDLALAQIAVADPPAPGWLQIFGNPLTNQIWNQPAGTTAFLSGTFDVTNVNWIGLSGGGGGGIASVAGTSPISVTSGSAPVVSIQKSDATHDGYVSSADWNTFNSKGIGSVTSVGIAVPQGLAISGCPITGSGTCVITYNGQLPVSSLGTGSPSSTNFLSGSGAWTPAVSYGGLPVTSLVQGSNIALTLNGSAVTVASTSAVTFPVGAPEGAHQYSFALHPEIGIGTALAGSSLPIRTVQVTGQTGSNNIIITLSSPINPLRWATGDTFRIASLPATSSLDTLNGITFTATSVGQNTPTGTVTFTAPTSIATNTYTVSQGTASNWIGSLDGHSWQSNRLVSTTTNPARTGSFQGARRDAWKFRAGAIDDSGIDIAAIRGAKAMSPANGVGAGAMTSSGTNNSGASSITVAKAAGANWSATTADYILIDQADANGEADLQMYKVSSNTTVTQGTTTALPITPNLRTNITAGVLIVASWSRTQVGDATGAKVVGILELADTPNYPDGCLTTTSGIVSSTGTSCGGSASAAGANQDIQYTTGSGVFAVDTGQFTYDSTNKILQVGTLTMQGKTTVPNQASYTNGAQACTLPGAGKSAWCFDTDGFFKISEGNAAFYRPGSGAGSGNVVIQGTPSAGQTAEWSDGTHIQGIAVTGTGNYVKGTSPTIAGPKLDVIKDINDKASITIAATANAVDYLTLTNAATANPATVTLSATGSDSNINVNIVSKGSGVVQCNGATCGGGGASYTNLFQSDANTLTQRNSGVAQKYQVMDSYTDASNYQGFEVGSGYVKTIKLGTGAARPFQFGVDAGVFRGWQVNTGFALLAFNTLTPPDIGSANNRVGTLFGTSSDLTGAITVTVANEAVTGTTLNKIAKLTGAPSTVIISGTVDTDDFEGIVTGGAGASGSATLARSGVAACVFDAATVAGHYVQNSSTVAGDCHDAGATRPTTGKIVGRVLSTNAAAGTFSVFIDLDSGGGAGGGSGTVTSVSASGGSPLFSVNVTTPTTTPAIAFTLSNANANTIYANATGSSAIPSFVQPLLTGSLFGSQGTTTQQLHGNAAGNLTWAQTSLATGVTGNLSIGNLNSGTNASSSTVWCGNGTWCTPAGGGNVSVTGTTPVAGESVEWASGTTIRRLANTGSGNSVRQTAPTIITPLIASIKDANGNPGLDFIATPSAVDSLTITNAATGSPVVNVGVQGADANIDLQLNAKGTGVVKSNGPIQTSGPVGFYFGPEGIDPGKCASAVDGFYASSANHYLTLCNNGGAQQKIIGSSADLSTSDFVIGAHFPFTQAGDIWHYNGTSWTNFAGNNSGTKFLTENAAGVLSWSTGTSSVAWSSLLAPASDLDVSMVGFYSHFNYTSAVQNAFAWLNTTAATSGASASSPTLGIQGNYWTGSASAQDIWQIQNIIANGSNGASTLTITHAGSSGLALVSAPGFSASTSTVLSGLQGSCASVGISGRDVLCADSTLNGWKMSNNNGTAIPVVGGPASTTSGDVAVFSGTLGGLLQDTGLVAANVSTAASPFTNGDVIQAAGANRTLVTSGVQAGNLVQASAVIVNGDVPLGNGSRGLTDSGKLGSDLVTSAANGSTNNILVYAANNKTTLDSGISISNTFHTATKADVLQGALSCADAGANDTYACNLSPAITAYVGRTQYCFVANTINTGAASINFNTRGALTIKKPSGGSITTDLSDGDIKAGQEVCGIYDGTNLQMTSQLGSLPFPTPTRAGDVIYWNGSTWVTLAGNNSGTNFLQENSSGVPTWSAGSSAVALSAITAAAGANTINNGDNAQLWNWFMTTSGQVGLRISENTAATSAGTPFLFQVDSIASSTSNVAKFTALGTTNGVGVLKTGFLTSLGTGGIDSNMLHCDVTTSTKCAQFVLSGITAANTRAVTIPDAASTTVVADTGASNNFLTAISALGAISKAQPSIASLSDGANLVTAPSAAGAANQVAVSNGADKTLKYATLSTTTTQAFFAGATIPGFRAIATGDLPAALANQTSINGLAITASTGTVTVANTKTLTATNTMDVSKTAGVAGGLIWADTTTSYSSTGAGATNQLALSGGTATPTFADFPDVKIIPAANCVNAVAGSGWSSTGTGMPAACRAGTNNFNGTLQPIPSAGGTAYMETELPGDWSTTVKPYISIYYGSGANTSGTVIWTVSTACTKQDGSVSDDPAWIAESAMGTQTMVTANRMWAQNAQLAGAMTNCIGGSTLYIKAVLSGTAASAINVSKAVLTTPRRPVVQAN